MGKLVWATKMTVRRVPGAYRLFVWFTQTRGAGKVYRIRFGPLKGMRWKRHPNLSYWYHLGLYEPHVAELIGSHLHPGQVFWDIGANAGYHTLVAARAVGPGGHVVAVEADPEVASVLREEIDLNGLRNCVVENSAVSEREGSVVLMRSSDRLQSALAEVGGAGDPVEVPATTLDALLRRHPRPDVVKIDIEGAESLALAGGTELLSGPSFPVLLLSVHGEAAESCTRLLHERGYEVNPYPGFEQMLVCTPGR